MLFLAGLDDIHHRRDTIHVGARVADEGSSDRALDDRVEGRSDQVAALVDLFAADPCLFEVLQGVVAEEPSGRRRRYNRVAVRWVPGALPRAGSWLPEVRRLGREGYRSWCRERCCDVS